MPAFVKPPAAAITDFALRLAVRDDGVNQSVDIQFSLTLVDASGAPVARPAGDLAPFLTAQQVTNFTNAALALYAKAKTELIV